MKNENSFNEQQFIDKLASHFYLGLILNGKVPNIEEVFMLAELVVDFLYKIGWVTYEDEEEYEEFIDDEFDFGYEDDEHFSD